jgi:hypothetical protein
VPFVVTGISQDGNTAALEQALKSAGLSLEVLEVLGPDDDDTLATGGHIDTAIITGGGLETGTGVPGITGGMIPGVTSTPRVAGIGPADGDSLWSRLADLAIPDDEVENYAEALEAGRSIVAYHSDAKTVTNVEVLFASAGLAKIKTF